MNKNSKLFPLLLLLVLLLGAGGFFVYNRYVYRNLYTGNLITKIREENKAGFDSLQTAINDENNLNYLIKKNISTGDFKTAYALMDSLPAFGKVHSTHLYRGMIYAEQKKYLEAIEEYNTAINEHGFSVALEKRGDIYIKMNKLDMAMTDYKKAYTWNFDYSLQIANTFALLKEKDSALKYYQIYLEHYPNDTAVQKKAKNLAN